MYQIEKKGCLNSEKKFNRNEDIENKQSKVIK